MKQDEFDLRLTQEMADLPPDPGEVQDYNPWQAAMSRILWGMALTTFRLEFFYLQYLLPLLGAALMYLGYRSLRRENPWSGCAGGCPVCCWPSISPWTFWPPPR